MAENALIADLLQVWFGATRKRPLLIPERQAFWFAPDPDRDRDLEARFGEACREARNGDLHHWAETPHGRLGLILLLDQLPRNLWRGSGEAFASDPQALALCLEGHREGLDRPLALIERAFFWMPLQHAEDLASQALGVRLFDTLAADDPANENIWGGFADFARKHRDIIERFGRFPHRNAALGRESTDEERAWLARDGERFGQ